MSSEVDEAVIARTLNLGHVLVQGFRRLVNCRHLLRLVQV